MNTDRMCPPPACFAAILFVCCVTALGIAHARGEEESTSGTSFGRGWELHGIIGDAAWLWHRDGTSRHVVKGESIGEWMIEDVDARNMIVRVRRGDAGEETLRAVRVSRDDGVSDGAVVLGHIQGITAARKKGPEMALESLRVDDAPAGVVLALAARAGEMTLVTHHRWSKPISFKILNVTVGNVLDRMLNLEMEETVGSRDGDRGRQQVEVNPWVGVHGWQRKSIACRVVTATAAVRALRPLLNAPERVFVGPAANSVILEATRDRVWSLEHQLADIEKEVLRHLDERPGGALEKTAGLETTIPMLEFAGDPLAKTLSTLSEISGCSFVVDDGCALNRPAGARLVDLTVREILNVLLPAYDCGWEPAPGAGIIRILPDEYFTYPDPTKSIPDARGETEPRTYPDLPGMDRVIPNLEYEWRPLNEVVREIADIGGFSYVVEETDLDGSVSCWFKDVTVRDALESILATNGYGYYFADSGVIGIGEAGSVCTGELN